MKPNMKMENYEQPTVIQLDIIIENGFATSTEPIGDGVERGWE